MSSEQIHVLSSFKGINENLASSDQGHTRLMNNVTALHNRIEGRAGVELLQGIQTTFDHPIIGLAQYTKIDDSTYILAFTTTKVFYLDLITSSWIDITGTAMTSGASNLISSTHIDGSFIFTNEVDAVRKWTGTGNTANVGGTPPLAKRVINFEDFLMLADVTISGTRYRSRIRYSEDWDTTWSVNDELNLNETPGGIRAWAKMGRTLYIYKSDGIVAIRFIGGPVRFSQHQVPFSLGIQAPQSLAAIPQLGHIFLATDFNLYLNANGAVNKLPANLRNTLHHSMAPGWAQHAIAQVIPEDDLYTLHFSSGGSWLDKRILFNYRSGEWSLHSYNAAYHNITHITDVRGTSGDIWSLDGQAWEEDLTSWLDEIESSSISIIAGMADKRVYRLDAGAYDKTIQSGKHLTIDVPRTYYTDWQELGHHGGKYLNSVDVWMSRTPSATVAISVAEDFSSTFSDRQVFTLGDDDTEGDILIQYNLKTARLGERFNLKFEFLPTTTNSNFCVLKEIRFRYTLTNPQVERRINVSSD